MIIGIIGGGQLAKMMVLAGYPMGQDFIVLDPASDAAAGLVAEQMLGAYDDIDQLQALAAKVDVVTFDFENVPAETVRLISKQVPVYPSAVALEIAQDRCSEKRLFSELNIPVANWAAIDNLADLQAAVDTIGVPAVLKTRRLGYDGKGQVVIRDKEAATLATAWNQIQQQNAILEALVPFEREVSLLSVRNQLGTIASYPLVHNVHREGILRVSTAPYACEKLQQQAEALVRPLLEKLDYVGVLAVEFFVKDDELIANEMAPRVHNTGHWTIEGAGVSQFENHLRAITGLPLGATEAHSHAAMINFISTMPSAEEILSIPGCHFHDYGKKPRAGRKLGHATLRASSDAKLQEKIAAINSIIDSHQ